MERERGARLNLLLSGLVGLLTRVSFSSCFFRDMMCAEAEDVFKNGDFEAEEERGLQFFVLILYAPQWRKRHIESKEGGC